MYILYPVLFFSHCPLPSLFLFFFFNDTATTEIYTLSLHDALPISRASCATWRPQAATCCSAPAARISTTPICRDRKSTRLNSSHLVISYAVFCLKKKKKNTEPSHHTSYPHTVLPTSSHIARLTEHY